MLTTKRKQQKSKMRYLSVFLICLWAFVPACSGGGNDDPPTDSKFNTNASGNASGNDDFNIIKIRCIEKNETDGLLSPQFQTVIDPEGRVHIAFYTKNQSSTSQPFSIQYITFDTQGISIDSPLDSIDEETILSEVDNCRDLSLCVDGNQSPIVAYQGGEIRAGGQEDQSDIMVSSRIGGTWSEYTAGIGFVERNPVFTDGLAGADLSAVINSLGEILFAYQFFYEGIDHMNAAFPDLLYVEKDPDNLELVFPEEQVEGNIYNTNGTANIQNQVGNKCQIITDHEDVPTIFYYAKLHSTDPKQKGLRVAKRIDGRWIATWVETGFEIDCISLAKKQSGQLAVACTALKYENGYGETIDYCLLYAEEPMAEGLEWEVRLVDDITNCGRYCSLAFDSSDTPAIAYFDEVSRDLTQYHSRLKLARKKSDYIWDKEIIATASDIGLSNTKRDLQPGSDFFYIGKYNTLWFDQQDDVFITSFSNINDTLYLITQN